MTDLIDLRSDTVTRPTEQMRRAMATAQVGDDWFGDDPTVNELQEMAAGLAGKDAALYLPSGTMCTQIALHALVRSGHLVASEASAHVCNMELTSAAVLSGITFHRITGNHGLVSAEQVAQALQPHPYDVTVVDLVTLENTHQVGGGTVHQVAEIGAIRAACQAAGVPLYLDGARIFNACTVTGASLADYAGQVDALMFCLSKGLGAPIGSMLVGDTEFIREARRLKITFGAAWRQAGVLAAAGLIALTEGPKRLAEDHANARVLAEGVAELLPGSVDPDAVPTNIVFVNVSDTGRSATQWRDQLAARGLLVTLVAGKVRMLTHRDASADDIQAALAAWRRAAASGDGGS